MYKMPEPHQITFFEFNQVCGLKLDENNEWVRLAGLIKWTAMEKRYAEMFPSATGRPAKPFRMAFAALIIQKRKNLSDRKLVQEIAENPYLQYFLGMEEYSHVCPFTAPALVAFRKRLTSDFLMEANELYLKDAERTAEHKDEPEAEATESGNLGTVILDATCSPANIKFPQDFVLVSEAREYLEKIIDAFCHLYQLGKPRTYRQIARKQYLALAKAKRRGAKKIRAFLRKHLGYLKRDIGYIEGFLEEGFAMPKEYETIFETIRTLYDQQKYMFDNHTHRVPDRIVSLSQPWIRPIVRGKAKAPTEFGAKYDVSVDEKGHARLEQISFQPYNESTVFIHAVEEYFKRTGHYPERILADQIYRTRANRAYCKEHGIRLSGPRLGRPAKDCRLTKQESKDNTDRIEVERFFSLAKSSYGAGLIMTKLQETTLHSIALSVFVANLFRTTGQKIFCLYFMDVGEAYGEHYFMEFVDAA